MRARTGFVLGLLATGGVALAATNAVWVSGTVETVTGETSVSATGGSVPLAGAAALVLLAAGAAVPLVTPLLARVVGAVVAALAALGAIAVAGVATSGDGGELLARAGQEATGVAWAGGAYQTHSALYAAVAALALGSLVGVLLVALAGRLRATRSRFETTTPRTAGDDRMAVGAPRRPGAQDHRVG